MRGQADRSITSRADAHCLAQFLTVTAARAAFFRRFSGPVGPIGCKHESREKLEGTYDGEAWVGG